ncbi:hypothetical protein SNEBB_010994 [Seison nebaliae]|nr:hypothetical protein SNEBB_010994 [Seison nebaliae]
MKRRKIKLMDWLYYLDTIIERFSFTTFFLAIFLNFQGILMINSNDPNLRKTGPKRGFTPNIHPFYNLTVLRNLNKYRYMLNESNEEYEKRKYFVNNLKTLEESSTAKVREMITNEQFKQCATYYFIHCYQCDSRIEPLCRDPFNANFTVQPYSLPNGTLYLPVTNDNPDDIPITPSTTSKAYEDRKNGRRKSGVNKRNVNNPNLLEMMKAEVGQIIQTTYSALPTYLLLPSMKKREKDESEHQIHKRETQKIDTMRRLENIRLCKATWCVKWTRYDKELDEEYIVRDCATAYDIKIKKHSRCFYHKRYHNHYLQYLDRSLS